MTKEDLVFKIFKSGKCPNCNSTNLIKSEHINYRKYKCAHCEKEYRKYGKGNK